MTNYRKMFEQIARESRFMDEYGKGVQEDFRAATPIVPRREMWTYTPPYFWLGREAEAA